ncbi:MAG: T9SS type A sorting domain-containing protein, partial [Bacteroidales bacterium]|nr:T9SS type A sorting domain-containing protein [Bacteroidales bacterium]
NVTAAFTGADFEISSYTQTTARVEWKPDFWTAGDVGLEDAELMRSPDISSVIAEIVAIEGWAAGNGVLIMAQDPDQVDKMHREAESWDGATDDNAGVGKPTLNVTYVVYPASVDAGAEFANTIFPNPTEGLVTIVNPSTDKFSYSIYSVTGKMIASRDNLSGTEINVDMTDFAKGMYLVDVRSANKSEVHKLMVK